MKDSRTGLNFIICVISCLVLSNVHAQLAECEQLNVSSEDIPGSCIAKTLAEQIGSGQGDETIEGSSVYLIKRDPARAIRRGRQLFQRKFSRDEGVGPRVNDSSTGDVTVSRALGAGLSDSCASCHDTGLLTAPKLGDKQAWAEHVHYGLDHMVQKVITGVGNMPAKGGNAKLTDHEIKAAVEYIIKQSQ